MLDCRVFDGSEELARIVLSGMCEISRKWGSQMREASPYWAARNLRTERNEGVAR
jgi:hypothetical protein